MSDIEFTKDQHVATVRLNRPEKKNAFTLEMIDEWAQFLEDVAAQPDVRAVILTGVGDNFCSGADLGHLTPAQERPIERKRMLQDRIHRIARAMAAMPCVTIAAVGGPAVGAGMDMALMCDLRFAGDRARFSEGYIRLGLLPGDGGCYYLPRIVGMPKALELMLTGEFVDAAEAHRIGLVNRVYEQDHLEAETQRFAADLANKSPIATRMIKALAYGSLRTDLNTSLDMASSHMAVVQSTDDYREAFTAFREHRKGRFVNA